MGIKRQTKPFSESIKTRGRKEVTIARRTAILCRALPQEKSPGGSERLPFLAIAGIHKVPVYFARNTPPLESRLPVNPGNLI